MSKPNIKEGDLNNDLIFSVDEVLICSNSIVETINPKLI